MGKPTGRNGREHMSQRGQQASFNGATGMSDIEGKAARVAASECGQRASFKSLLILIRSGDMCRKCALWFYTSGGSSASRSWPSLNLRSDELLARERTSDNFIDCDRH